MASQGALVATEEAILQGQAEAWSLIYAYIDTMAVKGAVELRIPDIIHSHGSPMSLSQIAAIIGSPTLNFSYLSRLMRLLVHKKFFSAETSDQSGETLYGLTHSSRWLLNDAKTTLAPLLLLCTRHAWSVKKSSSQLSATIKEGGAGFEKVNQGRSFWEVAAMDPELNKMFNNAMASTSKVVAQAILSGYKDGFQGVDTLVDVGGGTGYLVSEIVKAYSSSRIKGINFDMQHVVDSAPVYPGVTHVVGNMFDFIPSADAVIMKWILHDYSDEECLKILRNCKKAMSGRKGKLILVEMVVDPKSEGLLESIAMRYDLVMMANNPGGRERTKLEWINLIKEAGFSHSNFIKIPSPFSIIEAYASQI